MRAMSSPGQPVEPVEVENHEDVAAAQMVEAGSETGASALAPEARSSKMRWRSDPVERVELAVEDLSVFGGGHPDVADQSWCAPSSIIAVAEDAMSSMPRRTYRDLHRSCVNAFGVFVNDSRRRGRSIAVACAATITCLSWSGRLHRDGDSLVAELHLRRHRARGARRTVPAERGRASAGLRHALVPFMPERPCLVPVDPVASVRDPARRIGSGVSAACFAGTRRFPFFPVTATNATWPALPGGFRLPPGLSEPSPSEPGSATARDPRSPRNALARPRAPPDGPDRVRDGASRAATGRACRDGIDARTASGPCRRGPTPWSTEAKEHAQARRRSSPGSRRSTTSRDTSRRRPVRDARVSAPSPAASVLRRRRRHPRAPVPAPPAFGPRPSPSCHRLRRHRFAARRHPGRYAAGECDDAGRGLAGPDDAPHRQDV